MKKKMYIALASVSLLLADVSSLPMLTTSRIVYATDGFVEPVQNVVAKLSDDGRDLIVTADVNVILGQEVSIIVYDASGEQPVTDSDGNPISESIVVSDGEDAGDDFVNQTIETTISDISDKLGTGTYTAMVAFKESMNAPVQKGTSEAFTIESSVTEETTLKPTFEEMVGTWKNAKGEVLTVSEDGSANQFASGKDYPGSIDKEFVDMYGSWVTYFNPGGLPVRFVSAGEAASDQDQSDHNKNRLLIAQYDNSSITEDYYYKEEAEKSTTSEASSNEEEKEDSSANPSSSDTAKEKKSNESSKKEESKGIIPMLGESSSIIALCIGAFVIILALLMFGNRKKLKNRK
ncbi:hypothetical protein ACEF17_09400 [Streptococcus hyovaginalis]|uniref:hypothetical protein n=1 Tax=Streptococcus hyovaginalis TaxID=149015 RepID=UPI002A7E0F69|nr:hypothetical protein [Streptococcus hyovaginalis]MDY3023810.1 hypothetical protein [Streptococcus hyovaginalis]MDY4511291.1 hypothetical protein [Streptococcus hyovaginalis]